MTPTIFAEANISVEAIKMSTGEKARVPMHQEWEAECGNKDCYIHANYKTTVCFQASDDEIVEFLSNKGKIYITFFEAQPGSCVMSPNKPEMKCL